VSIDSPSDRFLPGSSFSLNQNGQIGDGDLMYRLQEPRHNGIRGQYSVGLAMSLF
jgi:hypothetical protein